MSRKKAEMNCKHCVQQLGVESKVEIYHYLQVSGAQPVNEIVEHLHLKQPTVSYHLRHMEKTGLLQAQRQGRQILYSVTQQCRKYHQPCPLVQLPL